MLLKYVAYFIIGGSVVSGVTWLASHSRGLLAAFFANMPAITAITFLTIYLESGPAAVIPYAAALVTMLFPWLAYIFAIIFLTPRLGFIASLLIGIFLYFIAAAGILYSKKLWG